MKRRDFVNWIGVGALASSLPVAIAACSPKAADNESDTTAASEAESTATEPAPESATESASGFVEVGTTSQLAQQGYITSDDALSVPVIVIEDPTNSSALIALASKCTHSGCPVAWQEDLFACPCHGSKFNPDGSVVEGPASEPLTAFAAKIEGDKVLVSPV